MDFGYVLVQERIGPTCPGRRTRSIQLQRAPRDLADPTPITPNPFDEENDPAVPVRRPQPLAKIDDPVRDRASRGELDDLVHASSSDLLDRSCAREVVRPPPPVHVDDAAIVALGEESDGGECADDAVLGTAEPLEVDPVGASEGAGLFLAHRLTLASAAEGGDFGRDGGGHAEPRVAPWLEVLEHHASDQRGEPSHEFRVTALRLGANGPLQRVTGLRLRVTGL